MAAGRDDDEDLCPLLMGADRAPRGGEHLVGRGDTCPAEFLNQEGHRRGSERSEEEERRGA